MAFLKSVNQRKKLVHTVFIRGQQSVFFTFSLPLTFPLPLTLSLTLSIPLLVTTSLWTEFTGEMQAGFVVEADPFCLSPGCSDDRPAHLSEAQGSAVEHGVLGIVFEAVVDNKAKICLKGFESEVAMRFQLVPHGLEVHWSVNVVQVVWHLSQRGDTRSNKPNRTQTCVNVVTGQRNVNIVQFGPCVCLPLRVGQAQ